MKIDNDHKHIWISNRVYAVYRRNSDRRYWDCGQSWGPTPEAAAREEHVYFRSGFKSVAEMHKFD